MLATAHTKWNPTTHTETGPNNGGGPPERFGNWNTIYKNFNRWAEQGVWARVLEHVQAMAHHAGTLDWVASIDSTVVRVHQHGATLPRDTGGGIELQEVRR